MTQPSAVESMSIPASEAEQLFQLLEQESLNPLLRVMRAVGDGVLVCGHSGNIRWMNEAALRMLQLAGVEQPLLWSSVNNPLLQETVNTVLQTSKSRVAEIEVSLPGTPVKTFEVHAIPMDTQAGPDGRREKVSVWGCVAVLRDITAIRTTEKMRRDFVANVSHELRTPLSVLKGYAETLLGGALEDPAVARQFVETMSQHAERLSHLVEDLLDLSRLESPNFQLELVPTDLKAVLTRVLQMEEPQIAKKNLNLQLKMPETLSPALAHSNSVEQVLINLLDNAIKYTPEQGRISVSVEEKKGYLQINIADSGVGIAAKHIPRLFERFYRVDKARSREMGGTGLGLAIVKHLIQLQNGNIWVKSKENEGSVFTFTLKKAE